MSALMHSFFKIYIATGKYK